MPAEPSWEEIEPAPFIPETDLEPAEWIDPDPVVAEEPKAETTATKLTPPPTAYAVVSGADKDPVRLDQCIIKNIYAKKSLTVHHLQRRLAEWGYRDAEADKDGFYGDPTISAVKKFQDDHDIEGDGSMNAATLLLIFKGDTNVEVIL